VIGAGEIENLRSCLSDLWDDTELRQKIGERGRRKAVRPIYSTSGHMASIYKLALRLNVSENGGSCSDIRYQVL